ncbi:MAG: hypothetical protein WDA00_07605, partial [Eubacteriales bacterium]
MAKKAIFFTKKQSFIAFLQPVLARFPTGPAAGLLKPAPPARGSTDSPWSSQTGSAGEGLNRFALEFSNRLRRR